MSEHVTFYLSMICFISGKHLSDTTFSDTTRFVPDANSLDLQEFQNLLTWIFWCITGHSGKHGHEFLEFEFSHGSFRYASNSNYRNDCLIRKESEPPLFSPLPSDMWLTFFVCMSTAWIRKKELEIRIGNHIAFEVDILTKEEVALSHTHQLICFSRRPPKFARSSISKKLRTPKAF